MKHGNFIIIGGDKRQKYLGEYLKKYGNTVDYYGLYDWDEANEKIKLNVNPDSIIILPLPVSKNGKSVFMPYSKKELSLDGIVNTVKKGNKLFGGMVPSAFASKLKDKGVSCYDYYDSTFISENAYLTAFGTLKIILEHIDFAISEGNFAVVGYGRVGRETADILKRLSCDVTVFARSDEARTNACLRGLKAEIPQKLSKFAPNFDVIVNTVPSKVIETETLKKIKADCKIIELASAPFGVDFAEAEKYSVSVIKAPGLPGKYTAKTAGELIAKKIVKILEKEEDNA